MAGWCGRGGPRGTAASRWTLMNFRWFFFFKQKCFHIVFLIFLFKVIIYYYSNCKIFFKWQYIICYFFESGFWMTSCGASRGTGAQSDLEALGHVVNSPGFFCQSRMCFHKGKFFFAMVLVKKTSNLIGWKSSTWLVNHQLLVFTTFVFCFLVGKSSPWFRWRSKPREDFRQVCWAASPNSQQGLNDLTVWRENPMEKWQHLWKIMDNNGTYMENIWNIYGKYMDTCFFFYETV